MMQPMPLPPNERITAWVTKYALTQGIIKMVGEVSAASPTYFHNLNRQPCVDAHGKDWHRTEAAALARVDDMIAARRKSITRSLTQLIKLSNAVKAGTFKVVDRTVPPDTTVRDEET